MPQNEKNDFHIGVQVILRDAGKILLGRRAGVFGQGSWGLPGGRLRQGETLFEAAARELDEEVGVGARKMRVVCISDATLANNYQLQVGVEVTEWIGKPEIREPDKCDSLGFFDPATLPSPLFVASRPIIECNTANVLYSGNPQR